MQRFHPTVNDLIAQQKAHAKARGKKFKLKPVPRQFHPLTAARNYRRSLQPLLNTIKSIHKEMKPKFEVILDNANHHRPTSDSIDKLDSYVDDIKRVVKNGYAEFYSKYHEGSFQNIAEKSGEEVNKFNEKQFDKTMNTILGVDVFAGEPWLEQEMKGFVSANVDLIKTIPDDYFDSVESIVIDGARSGKLLDDIADEIDRRTDVGENRAAFIARDQVSKFNGDLTRLRQTNVGINSYVWSTSLDERVRDSHEQNEGETFNWDDPPAETGHPGDDYLCRCVALPVIDEGDQEAEVDLEAQKDVENFEPIE